MTDVRLTGAQIKTLIGISHNKAPSGRGILMTLKALVDRDLINKSEPKQYEITEHGREFLSNYHIHNETCYANGKIVCKKIEGGPK